MKKKKTTALAKKPAPVLAKRTAPSLPEQIETLLMQGDLTGLSVPQRLVFYKDLCRTLGVNYRTRPFEYIVFTDRDQDDEEGGAPKAGKMQLYARADCAAQLRKIHHVGIDKNMRKRREGEFYYVEADAFIHEKLGMRTDTATGVVWLKKWKSKNGRRELQDLQGRELANAMMKAETKAKRRVTFSICGLHMLDESDLGDLTEMTYDVSETGRVIEVTPQLGIKVEESKAINDLAFYIAESDRSELSFKEKLDKHTAELRKLSPEQVDSLLARYRASHHSGAGAKQEEAATAEAVKNAPPAASAATQAASSDVVLLRPMAGGQLWLIEGPEVLLKEVRTEIKSLCKKQHLPKLVCDARGCGKMIGALERAKVPHRMESSGDGA